MSGLQNNRAWLEKHEWIIPLGLFLIFLAFTMPGISWGPWHPDEIVVRSIKALHGEWKFSEINFDYPDLPQYAMYWLGKAILALGGDDGDILVASRVFSAVLAGLTIILTYIIARQIGGSAFTAGLAGLFLICVSQMSHNGRFAHNDTYLIFFTTLAILLLIKYIKTDRRGWLYASFITVGMAGSSKYTGGSTLLVVGLTYLILQRRNLPSDWFRIGETLFIGGALTYLGYALGTPKALFWMSYYFKRVLTALDWQVNYGRNPDSIRGIFGQYEVLQQGLGTALYLLFAAAFLWASYQIIRSIRDHSLDRGAQTGLLSILVLAVFVFDLPIMISYNFQLRYFLPMMPPLAILAAFFVEDLHARASNLNTRVLPLLLMLGSTGIVVFSLARLASISLLFINDARIPASEFMQTLPAGSSLEHTNYPPSYPEGYFGREHNYPLYITKGSTDVVPTDKPYEFNLGEAGLLDRGTDYLIVDSFTAGGMNDPYTCEQVPVECEFFAQLEAGQSEHYRLLAEFEYTLPSYLPQVQVLFVNPAIRIYERIK
jgi:4-amino-4-deoxy-L-arabinose transferase-like glycosyltransferase